MWLKVDRPVAGDGTVGGARGTVAVGTVSDRFRAAQPVPASRQSSSTVRVLRAPGGGKFRILWPQCSLHPDLEGSYFVREGTGSNSA